MGNQSKLSKGEPACDPGGGRLILCYDEDGRLTPQGERLFKAVAIREQKAEEALQIFHSRSGFAAARRRMEKATRIANKFLGTPKNPKERLKYALKNFDARAMMVLSLIQPGDDPFPFIDLLEHFECQAWKDYNGDTTAELLQEQPWGSAVDAIQSRKRHWINKMCERREPAALQVAQCAPSTGTTVLGRVTSAAQAERVSQFPNRASWLKERLLERGWGTADPQEYGGPDRKTIEKIRRGESVRNDVLEKLASALSKHKLGTVAVLDIPKD